MQPCPKCLNRVSYYDNYCSGCGYRLNQEKTYLKIIAVSLIAMLSVLSLVYFSSREGITANVVQEVTSLNQKTLAECPYECCEDNKYLEKNCEGAQKRCLNNKCASTLCPYECCINDPFYQNKFCSDPFYRCKSNKCEHILF